MDENLSKCGTEKPFQSHLKRESGAGETQSSSAKGSWYIFIYIHTGLGATLNYLAQLCGERKIHKKYLCKDD